MCELCPRKDMFKLPYHIVGMFFKECRWTVEKSELILPRPNPMELDEWRGREKEVVKDEPVVHY